MNKTAGGNPLTPSTIIVQFNKTNLYKILYTTKLCIKLRTRPFIIALKLIAFNFSLKLNEDFTSKHESGSEFQNRDTRLIKDELKTSL